MRIKIDAFPLICVHICDSQSVKTIRVSQLSKTGNKLLFELIERAEKWLRENTYNNKVLKWETDKWGEIPADFGRK